MTTWFLKECPKCGGDLYLASSPNKALKCLQCSLEVKLSFIQERRKIEGWPAIVDSTGGGTSVSLNPSSRRLKRAK